MINSFICMTLVRIGWLSSVPPCRLSGLFSKSELTLFRVPDCVEYVVMASVPADEAEGCLGEYIILHDGIYRKVWSEHVLPMGDYRHWHEMAVRSVLL